ncbi:MAG: hypothetical protein Q9164_002095 [Protoblastenia rupestris]
MAEDTTHLLRPKPLRPTYNLTPTSTSDSSTPSTPADAFRTEASDPSSPDTFASKTRSVLNLTSSTLFGIYAPSDYDSNRVEPPTPSGNGSQTPLPRQSVDEDKRPPVIGAFERPGLRRAPSSQHPIHHNSGSYLSSLGLRMVLLFCFGVAYGIIISHLHDTQQVAPVQVQGLERWSWRYLIGWGGVSVLLGGLLPWVDVFWEEVLGINKDAFPSRSIETEDSKTSTDEEVDRPSSSSRSGLGADWNPVVRSIGAFIGIAFAIRRLPWQSTLQVSLTLALVNPVLWYLVDRSKPGFLLSLLVGFAGTAIAFGVNPEIVPAPAAPSPRAGATAMNMSHEGYGLMPDGLISNESIGVGTWIASVLFCSSVCFGNIGRRLALGTAGRKGNIS